MNCTIKYSTCNSEIQYRTVERDAICSVCKKDILRNEEKVIVIPCKVHGRSKNIICQECLKQINIEYIAEKSKEFKQI